ncbi:MAG: adenylosuccinate synthase [Caldilineaceae bacterium]|nr:adenylosuccinate synthase [Caldilineaceae bacterium]
MTITAVVGAQWGDEGKGRIVDYLAKRAHYVVRFQGGDNAGHTVVNDYGKNVLHIIPCGIFYPNVHNIIGTGCVVNPQSLLEEISHLKSIGVSCDRLWISSRAQMLLPYHRTLDELEEKARGADTIGTTMRGVGPAYSDKATRSGLRIGDLLQPDWLEGRLDSALHTVNQKLTILGGQPVDGREMFDLLMEFRLQLAPRIVDTAPILRMALEANNDILLEGQLGVMRDLDWGIYPYVTSSHPTAAFAPSGAGLPAGSLDEVYGVCKAYSTCVGDGPFPVELHDDIGKRMQDVGQEFGATTGRPRRCGWFDGVAIRYAAWLNGMTGLAITKLDVLDGIETLKICTGYRLEDGTVLTDTVPDTSLLMNAQPLWEEMPGWDGPTTGCGSWGALPVQARDYINRISELAGVPVSYVSVGPERDNMFGRGG